MHVEQCVCCVVCRAVPGVTQAEVSLLQLSAEVQYNAAVTCTDDLVTAVDDCGFDCKLLSVHSLEEQAEEQRPQVGGSSRMYCSSSAAEGAAAAPVAYLAATTAAGGASAAVVSVDQCTLQHALPVVTLHAGQCCCRGDTMH